MSDGRRSRIWVFVPAFTSFALVAGVAQLPGSKASRVRHRMMRKGKYIQQVHSITGCTGCDAASGVPGGHHHPGTLNALYDVMQIDLNPAATGA